MRDPIRFDFSQTKVYTCILKIPSKGVFTLPNMPSYGRIFRGTVRAFTLPEVNCLLELLGGVAALPVQHRQRSNINMSSSNLRDSLVVPSRDQTGLAV